MQRKLFITAKCGFQCPVCNGAVTFQVTGFDNVRAYVTSGYTTDCGRCGAPLLVEDGGKIVSLHEHIHESLPQWPNDGKGTGCLTLEE